MNQKLMTCGLRTSKGPCFFCGRGKQFFQIQAETFSGVLCAAHLDSWLAQQEEKEPAERNGQPVTS